MIPVTKRSIGMGSFGRASRKELFIEDHDRYTNPTGFYAGLNSRSDFGKVETNNNHSGFGTAKRST